MDTKDKKFILSRDVTFDDSSMLKPTISQQVEIEKTKGVSQQVESDATSPSLKKISITGDHTHGDTG